MACNIRVFGVITALALVLAMPAIGCPLCGALGQQTLTQEASQADLILYGTLSNSKFDPNATLQGTTEMAIKTVIKSHPFIDGKKTVTLNRYLPTDQDKPQSYLVFCSVFQNRLDAYVGMPLEANSDVAEYLKGAMDLRDKDATKRLTFFFKYLDNSDIALSNDAFQEFALADYKDCRPLAEKLNPDLLCKWLKDANTPPAHLGLYGVLLGHCGKAKHVQSLREILDDPARRTGPGADGMLAGYVMMQPKEGWAYVRDILVDSKNEFLRRYAALRTARFMADYRPDVVSKEVVAGTLSKMLVHEDIADMVIEDLRKWQCWDLTDDVLALAELKMHASAIIHRAILRFALQSQSKSNKAAEYVKTQRKIDGETVNEVEELLQLETSSKPAPPQPKATSSGNAASQKSGHR